MRRVRRLLELTATQRGTFLWSLALLPLAGAALHWRGVAEARALIARAAVARRSDLAPSEAARMVNAAASLLGVSCLTRSLVLWQLVRDRGASIRFGIARASGKRFAAHAWVELGGVPLNDRPDVAERYAALEGDVRGPGV